LVEGARAPRRRRAAAGGPRPDRRSRTARRAGTAREPRGADDALGGDGHGPRDAGGRMSTWQDTRPSRVPGMSAKDEILGRLRSALEVPRRDTVTEAEDVPRAYL